MFENSTTLEKVKECLPIADVAVANASATARALPVMSPERQELFDTWVNFLEHVSDWKNFVTLTYRDVTPFPDKAWMNFYSLVNHMNARMIGKNYSRKVKHSYFSYAVAMEYQKRDVIHFHFLTDDFLDFDYIHSFWNKKFGFAYIEKIKSKRDVCFYMCKYLLKNGEVTIYKKQQDNFELNKFMRERMRVLRLNQ